MRRGERLAVPHARHFSRSVKRAAFKRASGHCESCGVKLPAGGGGTHYDHVIPWKISEDSSIDNVQCLCAPCHVGKTAARDIPTIAKVQRLSDRSMGIKRIRAGKKLPGGRDTGISITMSRGVVRRQSQSEKHRETMAKRYEEFNQ